MCRLDSDLGIRDLQVSQSPRASPRSSRVTMDGRDYGFEPLGPIVTAQSLSSGGGIRDFFSHSDRHDDDAASHSSSARNNDSSLGSELDFRTVLKASLVISEGIHLEEVIVSLMNSVLQTAGADYGVLILKEEGNLHVETVGLLGQVSILEHEPLHTRPDLVPISVVNIVASLGEQIIRNGDDPKFELTYGRDSYFQKRRAKSVLCMPIQNQLKTMGILYLENKLVNHAFTRQRQELLNLLCTQAAVTIDKARLYRQMELAKKAAEEATAEKSTFLANMSHEIRTPFNALLSCSIFLMDTNLSEQQREYVETIRNSAVLTLQIIDGILDFSKIEYGAIELQTTPFSLRDCVESALQLVAEPAATKDLELAFQNRCSNIDLICGDITRFRQCIINLIGNAVKFTQEGYIVITSQASQMPNSTNWKIQVDVTDTGIGIPEEASGRLFRAFSQVDTSTRRTFGGTGLGLAISKKLAQMMGGDIWFDSKEGQGTTFHFTIVADVMQKVWTTDSRLEGKQAIVADAHKISSTILANELEREGLKCTRTGDVQATLEALERHGKGFFDVALIDLSVDNTYAIFDKIQQFDPRIRVILMSRFGAVVPPEVLNHKCVLSFVRPAPRARYVSAVHDALDPTHRKQEVAKRPPELEILKSLGTRHPLNILLAEDNPVNTRVALQHLKRMGYSAKHAKDGIEVLELCEKVAAKGEMFDVSFVFSFPKKNPSFIKC
jgi:osomolarity two-component system sensor histidine kinase CHK1